MASQLVSRTQPCDSDLLIVEGLDVPWMPYPSAESPIQYEPAGQTFVTQRIGSVANAKRDLGFEATTELTDGLGRLMAWRRAQQQTEGCRS